MTNIDRLKTVPYGMNAVHELVDVLRFLKLQLEFYTEDVIRCTKCSLCLPVNSADDVFDSCFGTVVGKLFYSGMPVEWQYGINDDSVNCSDDSNWISTVREMLTLARAWIGKSKHDAVFVSGLLLKLMQNGICLKCNGIIINIPSFSSLNELKLKLTIEAGSDETPFAKCDIIQM